MIDLHAVRKSHGPAGPRAVLDGIDARIGRGEFVAIMGDSGSGKTTLLNLIAGLDLPDSGRIEIDGIDLTALDDRARTLLRRRRMGFVFQAFHLLPHLDAGQNIALPLELLCWPRAAIAARRDAMIAALGLAGCARRLPGTLSGGEMQRVAIGRALAHGPDLLLADEPTGNLDAGTAADVLELMAREVRAAGCTTLMVTHSPAAAAVADRVLVLGPDGLRPAART